MLSRRAFLLLSFSAILSAACQPKVQRDLRAARIGLALGGGGARGLAHIPMLEVLDALQLRPYRIAGTSIGAVIGALYASGLSGGEIRALVDRFLLARSDKLPEALLKKDWLKWIEFIDPEIGRGGLVSGERFVRFLTETIQATRFNDLRVPLQVVTADLWSGEQVVLSSGQLIPALQASIAIPGLFSPVEYRGRTLVDGAAVNPVPYDLLLRDCDVVIAIDVGGARPDERRDEPTYFETVFNSIQIMQQAIMAEKTGRHPPDIYIKPELQGVRVLEFYKAEEIYAQAEPAQRQLQRALRKRLRS